MLQIDPARLIFENSHTPPADDTARRELMSRSGLELSSQIGSDQEPMKVWSTRKIGPETRSSCAFESHLSSGARLLVALKSRRAARENESHPFVGPCKNPSSLRRDCTESALCGSFRSKTCVGVLCAMLLADASIGDDGWFRLREMFGFGGGGMLATAFEGGSEGCCNIGCAGGRWLSFAVELMLASLMRTSL